MTPTPTDPREEKQMRPCEHRSDGLCGECLTALNKYMLEDEALTDRQIAALESTNSKLAAEIAAWREYYVAGVALDDLDYTHPNHAEAVARVVKATEALTPLSDGTIEQELKIAREWTERETLDREAHQTELATLRADLAASKEQAGKAFDDNVALTQAKETAEALVEQLGKERDKLQAEVEALNGKLTAAILGNEAELDAVRKERDDEREYKQTAIDLLNERGDKLKAAIARAESAEAALKQIADPCNYTSGKPFFYASKLQGFASAALAPVEISNDSSSGSQATASLPGPEKSAETRPHHIPEPSEGCVSPAVTISTEEKGGDSSCAPSKEPTLPDLSKCASNSPADVPSEGRGEWLPIETAPKEETESFLVLLPKNGVADYVILQVSRFQGDIYPDALNGNVDYEDRVLNATHWMKPPMLPTEGSGA